MRKEFWILILCALLIGCAQQDLPSEEQEVISIGESQIFGEVYDTDVKLEGEIMIEGVGEFKFNPDEILSVRNDIFTQPHFSVFDVIVYLYERGDIDLEYHFDEGMNTHVIDDLNGNNNWWYMVYYDGGWPENNNFRMDHYPYKDKMYIRILKNDKSKIERFYEEFRKEVERKNLNVGKVIIPKVILDGPKETWEFENVEVTSHNLRADILQEDVITAIDVVMSLADQGKISYGLKWYPSIGSAGVVKSYWVEKINDAWAKGRCGFVYEAGSEKFKGFRGNHIHLPSDMRVLNSPDYVEYFWICI